jgi:hypothetical protein
MFVAFFSGNHIIIVAVNIMSVLLFKLNCDQSIYTHSDTN